MGLAAYKKTIRESESPRQIERRILSRVTHELQTYVADFDKSESRFERQKILAGGLRDTLVENQRIWAALRSDLAEPGNTIPDSLKASLISIAMWIDRQCSAVIAGEGGLAGLVEINSNIVAGLAGRGATEMAHEGV
ncbi:MAG: flaF protein [Rhodobacteraceae bacterium]|nr:flaF protein [Paracoccaceae bacterium]|tara:strand:- start:368 stop:778 length:411 start_codon:yes stop_codon:yes gene_type:complete